MNATIEARTYDRHLRQNIVYKRGLCGGPDVLAMPKALYPHRQRFEDMNWQPISTAPLDGRTIFVRNKQFPHYHAMGWSSARKRWEGVAFAPLRFVQTWWDETSPQPDEWAELFSK